MHEENTITDGWATCLVVWHHMFDIYLSETACELGICVAYLATSYFVIIRVYS
jgi:hypothetical protein